MSNDNGDASEDERNDTNERSADQREQLDIGSAPISKDHRRASQERSERDEHGTDDHLTGRMIDLQSRLVVFTAIGLGVSIFALAAVAVQSYEAVTGAATASRSADAADRLARAAQTQAAASSTAAEALNTQAQTARQEVSIASAALGIDRSNSVVAKSQADALIASSKEQDKAAYRQLLNTQLLIDSVGQSLGGADRLSGSYHFSNNTPVPIIIQNTFYKFSLPPLFAKLSPAEMKSVLDSSSSTIFTLAPGLVRTYTSQSPNSIGQTLADAIAKTSAGVALQVGIKWIDGEKSIHHAYACTEAYRKSDGSFVTSACETPLDD